MGPQFSKFDPTWRFKENYGARGVPNKEKILTEGQMSYTRDWVVIIYSRFPVGVCLRNQIPLFVLLYVRL